MSKPLTNLSFKLATKKKVNNKARIISSLVYCICEQSETGEFKACLRIVSNMQKVTNWIINFSPKSYSLKDKEKVFSIKSDERGKSICYIRTPEQYRYAPAKSRLYTPFCKDWVYSGYIIKINNILYFDIKEAIWHKDFIKEDLDIKENELKS